MEGENEGWREGNKGKRRWVRWMEGCGSGICAIPEQSGKNMEGWTTSRRNKSVSRKEQRNTGRSGNGVKFSTSLKYLDKSQSTITSSRPRTSQIRISSFGLQPSLLLAQDAGTSLHQSISSSDLHGKNLFPEWLTARKDFQDVRTQYERLDNIDCFLVCTKPSNQRSEFEIQAIINLMRTCPFFVSMKDYQLRTISQRFHSVSFKTGQTLMKKGDSADCLYLIVTGKVGIYIQEGVMIDQVIERNVVGETAINTRSIRTATVIALTTVKALRLTYEDYDITAFKIKLMDFHAVSQFLRGLAHFQDWNVAKLYRLASVILVMQYKKGQTLYSVGEPAHDLYVIREGKVAVQVEILLQRTNRWPVKKDRWQEVTLKRRFQKTLRVCEQGDFFGEQELSTHQPRHSTATCLTDSIIFIIKDEFYREIFSDREKKALCERFLEKTDSNLLINSLEKEKNDEVKTAESMLNGLNLNSLPVGRETFGGFGGKKKQKWAKLMVERRKLALRKGLVMEEKSEREIRSVEDYSGL